MKVIIKAGADRISITKDDDDYIDFSMMRHDTKEDEGFMAYSKLSIEEACQLANGLEAVLNSVVKVVKTDEPQRPQDQAVEEAEAKAAKPSAS